MTTTKIDIYQIVTNKIIESLEKGVVPWKSYLKNNCFGSLPKNVASKREYRGANIWLLSMNQAQSNIWGTYNQWKEKGKQVKKGEKGTFVIFWKMLEKQNQESGKSENIPLIRYSNVFNEAQTEGFSANEIEIESEFNPIEKAETLINGFPLGFPKPQPTDKGYAHYSNSLDGIFLPKKEESLSEHEYYRIYFHEAIHATGHKSRLNRLTSEENFKFGSPTFSKEELVAEIGASFLNMKAGILDDTLENSVAYIGNWLAKLRNDNKFIVQASAQAQRAVDYLTNTTFED
jgi:antirestriction protein ArdC